MIAGLKDVRLLAQQPVALLPKGMGMHLYDQDRLYFLELTFEDNTVMNIPITKKLHDQYIEKMRAQGVGIEHRVSARGSTAPEGVAPAPVESLLALDRPVTAQEVEGALRAAADGEKPLPRENPFFRLLKRMMSVQ